jgi:hypothetical protein
MLRILVNGSEETADLACQCWGELLERLDRRVAADGQVLTAIRFDGVDQPSFRDPACEPQPMGGIRVIDADSASPRVLLDNSVDEAIVAARALAAGAARLGGAFRGFDVSGANHDLVDMARGLGTLVAIVQTLSQAIGVSVDSVRGGDRTGSQMIAELTTQTDSLIAAQRDGDWITVADVIEYDIASALQRWPELFEALRDSIPA